ncbi:hypothetical protein MPNTM1_01534 [Mycolicibacterium parafortuitum]|uniref:hypothetical protein n=1 Tax=Mycolicibacterium parafortuitum TaxID=39692 RepID=UPI000CF2D431|nr:hypothetical protein CYL16_23820 [Mycobacterium sp. EPG1]
MSTTPTRLLAAAAAALLLAGCAGSTESGDGANQSATGTAEQQTPTSAAEPAPEQLVIDVTIKGGKVTPTNEQLRAGLNEPIVVRVDSDVPDELHVHSTPEHSFPIGVGPQQSFEFSVTVPGRVDVELHEAHTTIATIQVQ